MKHQETAVNRRRAVADNLRIVTHARWMADDFKSADVLPIVQDLALGDLPDKPSTTAWWCPQNYAARLLASGIDPFFQSQGHDFLSRSHMALGQQCDIALRETWAGRLDSLPDLPSGFCKPAEAKYELLPAMIYESVFAFVDAARVAGLTEDSLVQWSEPISLVSEFRHFVAHGQVVASALYMVTDPDGAQRTWDTFEGSEGVLASGALSKPYAQSVVDALGDDQPDGWVLDMGFDDDGGVHIIEANAAWSSNPYECDPTGVIESVLSSQGDPDSKFLWTPDVLLSQRAAKSRPLGR